MLMKYYKIIREYKKLNKWQILLIPLLRLMKLMEILQVNHLICLYNYFKKTKYVGIIKLYLL